jgi:acyl-CoA thioesterase
MRSVNETEAPPVGPTAWADTLVPVSVGADRYQVSISGVWNVGRFPNGGYLLALTAAAARAHVSTLSDEQFRVITATGHYLRAGEAGPAEVDVQLVRRGRTLISVQASLSQGGRELVRALLAFAPGTVDTGRVAPLVAAPRLPPPEYCIPALGTLPTGLELPIVDQVDIRMVQPGYLTGQLAGPDSQPRSTVAAWFRFREPSPVDELAACLVVDAFTPVPLEWIRHGWSPTLELTIHPRRAPAPGWLRVIRRTRLLADGHYEEDAEVWDSTDALIADSRQLARLTVDSATGPTPEPPLT